MVVSLLQQASHIFMRFQPHEFICKLFIGIIPMDPNNPVVKLCVAGMEAEAEGRMEDAHALFTKAWKVRQDNFDGCIAAHYLARHQSTPTATFYWNQLALQCADAIADERVKGFYPSLYLNMGKSYEELGNATEAHRYYDKAAVYLASLPDSPYKTMVTYGINAGQQRK
jgi:tetratricopeptide (TPR) repeat protein